MTESGPIQVDMPMLDIYILDLACLHYSKLKILELLIRKLVKHIASKSASKVMVFVPTFLQYRQRIYRRHRTKIHQQPQQTRRRESQDQDHKH